MWEKINLYRVLMGQPEEKRPLARPYGRLKGNIKMNVKETGW